VQLVTSWEQIRKNIETLLSYRWSEDLNKEYHSLIQKGICFVVTLDDDGNHVFSPSRFIGYVNNTHLKHIDNLDKHGGETNDEINKILGKEPEENEQLEKFYREYCLRCDIEYKEKGAYGSTRKYWVYN